MTNGIYQSIYELVHQYIYGGVELTEAMELVNITLSTIGCLAVTAIPFVVVFFALRFIFSLFDNLFN